MLLYLGSELWPAYCTSLLMPVLFGRMCVLWLLANGNISGRCFADCSLSPFYQVAAVTHFLHELCFLLFVCLFCCVYHQYHKLINLETSIPRTISFVLGIDVSKDTTTYTNPILIRTTSTYGARGACSWLYKDESVWRSVLTNDFQWQLLCPFAFMEIFSERTSSPQHTFELVSHCAKRQWGWIYPFSNSECRVPRSLLFQHIW